MKEKVTDAGENPALPRNILNACFWKPGFQAEREDEFLDAMPRLPSAKTPIRGF